MIPIKRPPDFPTGRRASDGHTWRGDDDMMSRFRNCAAPMTLQLAAAALAAALPAASGQTDERAAEREQRRTPVVRVIEQCRDAVVNISTTRIVRVRSLLHESLFDEIFDFGRPIIREQAVHSVGSGVLIHEDGLMVTNAHVIAQASDVQVILADKHTLAARIVAVDPEHDLAVLKLESDRPMPHVRLGRSNDIMIGETVIVIGNPLGLQHSVTTGIVSALGRDLQFGDEMVYRGLIQTDAAINPGNSGGPLLNITGELIGINTAIRGDAQNVGFAIPADRLWDLLPQMLDVERHERVRVGLRVAGEPPSIEQVRPDSPAAQAGLRPKDRIVRLNGRPVRDVVDYYARLLAQQPGSDVRLTVQRDGAALDTTLKLQPIPAPDGAKLGRKLLGMELADIPADVRRRYELAGDAGVLVEAVSRGGPAASAGIQAGDILMRVERVAVASLHDVGLALESVGGGERVVLEGLRLRADPPFFWQVTLRTQRGG
jgi:serine protease Do